MDGDCSCRILEVSHKPNKWPKNPHQQMALSTFTSKDRMLTFEPDQTKLAKNSLQITWPILAFFS